jgi:hypothetical protein
MVSEDSIRKNCGMVAVFHDGTFDIFRESPDAATRWIASVRLLSDAKAYMDMMSRRKPGKYFVWHKGKQIAHVDTTKRKTKPRRD